MQNTSNDLFQQVQKDNKYYKSIIVNNSFYIVRTDLLGNYIYLNPFFCTNLGIKEEDFIGKHSLGLIIPEDHELCISTVEKCFANPEHSHWVILRKPSPSGQVSTQWEFKILTDEAGEAHEILCIGHDITPLIIKQEELQNLVDVAAEQNTRLVNFTYIVSHNIRSHVANIIGIINLNDIDDPASRDLTWSLIKESTKGLDETVKNLSGIISIQSNISLPLDHVYVRREIDMLMNSITVLLTEVGTTVDFKFSYDEFIVTNPAYFESILLNLFTNAIKYKTLERPLAIEVSMYTDEKYKVLVFKDNGMGIDLEKYGESLFGMYKTFHGNSDAKGLGLFIIKTQIEAMKGKIEVESVVDKGTTFKLFFNGQ